MKGAGGDAEAFAEHVVGGEFDDAEGEGVGAVGLHAVKLLLAVGGVGGGFGDGGEAAPVGVGLGEAFGDAAGDLGAGETVEDSVIQAHDSPRCETGIEGTRTNADETQIAAEKGSRKPQRAQRRARTTTDNTLAYCTGAG